MKNILVTSLGTTWAIVPELIGFTNGETYNLYKNHPKLDSIQSQRRDAHIKAIDELWVITTNGDKVSKTLKELNNWRSQVVDLPVIKFYSYSDLVELNTLDEIPSMRDLVYRTVLHARGATKGGKLYLSLAGGRKNMSADMQAAAYLFGCDALLHLMDNRDYNAKEQKEWFKEVASFVNIPDSRVEIFFPFVLQKDMKPSPILFAEPNIIAENYPLEEIREQESKLELFNIITQRRRESSNSLLSIYKKRAEGSQTTYAAFQLLPPEIVERLQNEKIGDKAENEKRDLEWLKKIPKAELHCHFGGVLSPEEMIEVARFNWREIESYLKINKDFSDWFFEIEHIVEINDLYGLPKFDPKHNIRDFWLKRGIPEPIAISAFIIAFQNNAQLLSNYIYLKYSNFKSVGIDTYEKLGDLQGSSLLQNEVSIRKTCQILKTQCKKENIKYIEVRCSPMNYTREGLSAEKVVQIMMEELRSENTIFKLIFIASRHGEKKRIKEHINLALELLKSEEFKKMFVGFDLAGAEAAKSPKELRDDFMEILEKSIPTTIHAGENMPVKSIWEAVYHLSAERIGHGLTLNEDKDLKQRFRERKIAIELCPSSNDQIIGYHDYHKPVHEYLEKIYPLKQYLDEGLKVTINTDDPGMSLTNLTQEYYKAACMTKGGLSKWEILQINRNGFKYGFLPLEEKKKLLLDVEDELFKILN